MASANTLTQRSIEQRVIGWINRKKNPGIRPRDLVNAKVVKTAAIAEAIIQQLLDKKLGDWAESEGRKKPRFYLLCSLQSAHWGNGL